MRSVAVTQVTISSNSDECNPHSTFVLSSDPAKETSFSSLYLCIVGICLRRKKNRIRQTETNCS